MANSRMVKALAKVVIAAAWADGAIGNEELNSLKDLLFRLPDMAAKDWAELEIYMENPIGEAERQRLVAELQEALSRRRDKELALSTLEQLAAADGVITEGEEQVVGEIKAAIEAVNTNIFAQVGRLVSGPLQRREAALAESPNREHQLEDFVRNRVFYNMQQRLHLEEAEIEVPEDELRKLSLAGGLMARVAYVDREVSEDEVEAMSAALQSGWGLYEQAAALVAEVAVSAISKRLDYYRMGREFFEVTTEEERVRFAEVLFAVADGDGFVSHEEIEEVRDISNLLKLTHRQFIDAKMTIPRERRAN